MPDSCFAAGIWVHLRLPRIRPQQAPPHVPQRSPGPVRPQGTGRSEHRQGFRHHSFGEKHQGLRQRRDPRHRTRLPGQEPVRPDPEAGAGQAPGIAGRGQRERRHHQQGGVARRAARREADPGHQEHHRGGIGQGRRGQEHHGREPGTRAGGRRRERGHARRRHLRALAADHARHQRPAGIEGRQGPRAHGRPRHPGDLDRVPHRRGHPHGLARPDGDAGPRAVAEGNPLARHRLPDRRPAARHRRHPADPRAEGAGHRGNHRHDAAGDRAARCAQGPQDVREGRHPDPRHRGEHEHPHLLQLRPRGEHLRRRRR